MRLPDAHRRFLDAALPRLRDDPRILAVAMAGSGAIDQLDEWSDLDLIIVVAPNEADHISRDRQKIAEGLSPLLSAFTGEHVGEPRLLICLYQLDPGTLLHVDLKFIMPDDCRTRIDDPVVLWDRDGRVEKTIESSPGKYPPLEAQWAEERFWTWIHYATVKIGRGELFDALEGLSFLRTVVLAPLAQQLEGFEPRAVRRIEEHAPRWIAGLRTTIAVNDEPRELVRAYRAAIDLYLKLRDDPKAPAVSRALQVEAAARRFFEDVAARVT